MTKIALLLGVGLAVISVSSASTQTQNRANDGEQPTSTGFIAAWILLLLTTKPVRFLLATGDSADILSRSPRWSQYGDYRQVLRNLLQPSFSRS